MDEGGIDPVTRQYIIFSAIVSFILSFFINFFIVNLLQNSFILYGFPLSLQGIEGFTNFIYRVINTIVVGVILIIPVYLLLNWLKTRVP